MTRIEEIEQEIKTIVDDIHDLQKIMEEKRLGLYELARDKFFELHRIEKENSYIRGILDFCRTGK